MQQKTSFVLEFVADIEADKVLHFEIDFVQVKVPAEIVVEFVVVEFVVAEFVVVESVVALQILVVEKAILVVEHQFEIVPVDIVVVVHELVKTLALLHDHNAVERIVARIVVD